MSGTPSVTVLMSFYNDLPFIEHAVKSVLYQTFNDFEFLIIDDGSTDGSSEYVKKVNDSRVRRLCNDHNLGLTASLRRGVEEAKGTFIARMDADDICQPDRLARQVQFLKNHPDIGICGSSCIEINEIGKQLRRRIMPEDPFTIRWSSLFNNPFVHTSIMLRRAVLEDNSINYNQEFRYAQDYDLWERLLHYTSGYNLPQPLLLYRVHSSQVTVAFRQSQLAYHRQIAGRALRAWLPKDEYDEETITDFINLFSGLDTSLMQSIRRIELTTLYLNLLEEFFRKLHPSRSSSIRRFAVKQVVVNALRPPFLPGWRQVVSRLLQIDLFFTCISFPIHIARWFRSQVLN